MWRYTFSIHLSTATALRLDEFNPSQRQMRVVFSRYRWPSLAKPYRSVVGWWHRRQYEFETWQWHSLKNCTAPLRSSMVGVVSNTQTHNILFANNVVLRCHIFARRYMTLTNGVDVFHPKWTSKQRQKKKNKKVRTVMQFGRRGAVVCRRPLLSSRANELPL